MKKLYIDDYSVDHYLDMPKEGVYNSIRLHTRPMSAALATFISSTFA